MTEYYVQVNYIVHLEKFLSKLQIDGRLRPWHVSLYMALFYCWNHSKFKKEISINRDEMMMISRIGSANTYTKTIKELDEWNYIKYMPSRNRFIGSKVIMYRFDNTPDKTPDKTSDKTNVTPVVKQVRPSINNTNNNKHKSESNSPRSSKSQKRFSPPKLDEVRTYFKEQKSNETEATKFFNHYESNGWKVGGKTKMKNWKAAVRNWIMRSNEFKNEKKQTSSRLNVNESKNYDIPL